MLVYDLYKGIIMGWKRTSHADDGESGFGVSLHAERERERCAWLHATASSSPRPIASRQLTQTVTIYGRSPPFPLPAEKKAVKRPVRHHCVPWPYTFREISQNKPPHNVFPQYPPPTLRRCLFSRLT